MAACAAVVDDDNHGSMLPVLPEKILREVLDMLDSVQRANCRRVSSVWDAVVGVEWRVVWVSFAHQRLVDAVGNTTTPDEAEWQRSAYLVGMCLWKCLSAATQTIIISNAVQQRAANNGMVDCFHLIDAVRQEQPLDWGKDVTVIMQRFHWDLEGLLDDEVHRATAAVERVVWKDGTFSGPVEHFRRQPVKCGVSVRSEEMLEENGDSVPIHLALSEVLEDCLAEPEDDGRALLVQWLREAVMQPPGSRDRQRIDKILQSCQEEDPRVLAEYGVTAWTVDTMRDRKARRLTKLTCCALQREMAIPPADCPSSPPQPVSIYNRPDAIFTWNAVDVQGSDGSGEYGRVINALNGGLVVDFDCPGRRAELVDPSTFHVWRSRRPPGHTFSGSLQSADAFEGAVFLQRYPEEVEVLARETADRPWTWHAATPLYLQMFWKRYIFLEMQLSETEGGVKVKRLLRAHPVRLLGPGLPEAAEVVGKGDFVTRSRALPANYWGGGPVSAALWEAWKEAVQASELAFWPVSLVGDTLVYLQELLETPLLDGHLEELLVQATKKLQPPPPTLPAVMETASEETRMSVLPVEVLRDVLDMLDTVQRVKCRRVWALWDAVVGTEWRVIWVSFAHQRLVDAAGKATTAEEAAWQRSAYLVGMCLWKCLTEDTETIIVTNAVQQRHNTGLEDCFSLVSNLLHDLQVDDDPDPTMIIHNFHWELYDVMMEDVHGAAAALEHFHGDMDDVLDEDQLHAAAAAVERVVWVDGTFGGPVEHFRREPVRYAVSYRCAEAVDVYGSGEPDYWHLHLRAVLETDLPSAETPDGERMLADWLSQAAASPDCRRVDRIVRLCQEEDPRVLVQYGNVPWQVEDVQGTAGVRKLTRLARCALQREMTATPPRHAAQAPLPASPT
ncbi:uncharacterized protein LOC129596931 [Paramacrobiotus metropolitanus]|uniref:uncharacterized protein LOC129596931 n=1 Tax=Paramacrobiotus metropolitanus TaxID=2943436 RepID=UPI00244586A8|nr:uncharacterized protein LOC129596931 [Paramacrobiotus metropolitanus]